MIARAETLMSKINQLKSGINPNGNDYQALDDFYFSTRQVVIDLSGNPNYFEHIGSGLQGLGSSRER